MKACQGRSAGKQRECLSAIDAKMPKVDIDANNP